MSKWPESLVELLFATGKWPRGSDAFCESYALARSELAMALATREMVSDETWLALYAKGQRTDFELATQLATGTSSPVRRNWVIEHDHRVGVLWALSPLKMSAEELRALCAEPKTPREFLEYLCVYRRDCGDAWEMAARRLSGYHLLTWLALGGMARCGDEELDALFGSFDTWYSSRHSRGEVTCEHLLDLVLAGRGDLVDTFVDSDAKALHLAAARWRGLGEGGKTGQIDRLAKVRLDQSGDEVADGESVVIGELLTNPSVDPKRAMELARAKARCDGRSPDSAAKAARRRIGGRKRAVRGRDDEIADRADLDAVIAWAVDGSSKTNKYTTRPRVVNLVDLSRNPNLSEHQAWEVGEALCHYDVRAQLGTDTFREVAEAFGQRYIQVTSELEMLRLINHPNNPHGHAIEKAAHVRGKDVGAMRTDELTARLRSDYEARWRALSGVGNGALTRAMKVLGPDEAAWDILAALSEGFSGSFDELLDSCATLAGCEGGDRSEACRTTGLEVAVVTNC
jgi:hypothetical protein